MGDRAGILPDLLEQAADFRPGKPGQRAVRACGGGQCLMEGCELVPDHPGVVAEEVADPLVEGAS